MNTFDNTLTLGQLQAEVTRIIEANVDKTWPGLSKAEREAKCAQVMQCVLSGVSQVMEDTDFLQQDSNTQP